MCDGRLHFYDRLQILEEKDRSLEQRERLRAVEKPLLAWYASRARKLPWREDPKPYRVWISEIMLQQTRVEAVKPYFERFMEAFPEIRDLAQAEDDRLMKLWEGLGYYSRARNLKAAAIQVMERFNGALPASYAFEPSRNRQLYGGSHCFDCLRYPRSGCGWKCASGRFPYSGRFLGHPKSLCKNIHGGSFKGSDAEGLRGKL